MQVFAAGRDRTSNFPGPVVQVGRCAVGAGNSRRRRPEAEDACVTGVDRGQPHPRGGTGNVPLPRRHEYRSAWVGASGHDRQHLVSPSRKYTLVELALTGGWSTAPKATEHLRTEGAATGALAPTWPFVAIMSSRVPTR